MKKYVHGIGPCYVLTSGERYMNKHGWRLVEPPRWNPDQIVRISKESKVNLIK
jgi:hypothetical protein